MSEGIRARSGWNGEALPDSLRRRWAAEQERERREEARAAREREQIREYRRQADIQASIVLAQERGEEFDMREAMQHGVGRTKSEALSYMAAVSDVQDMREERARLRRLQQLERGELESWQADNSPSNGEMD